ncbi:TonB-dependent receptor [Alterisphingorhabdus coralli]|uniref:TonB-dependent receptor n=1 Tax=Alterisphingorhabdus coralli TaxID=3071408 RepID=A0AA97I0W3_9SPHN|nr:TonB-dependent receptor [Parasphingorhabdus sp. SCSIO 66989]WOE74625.1 TonB-dependent receptor [Parasphingorhabdus sp. SCSIO 66989]
MPAAAIAQDQPDPCLLIDCTPDDGSEPSVEIDDPAATRENITVLGAPLDDPLGNKAYAVSEIGPRELANEASGRIENALRNVPGLQQFRRSDSRSANPTSQGVTLRGLGGNAASRALLTLDGVPQADPFGGWVSFPGYDALAIENVRVRRGGGTGSDGAGALAGTIDLSSFGVAGQSRYSGNVRYGSRDSLEANIAAEQKLGSGGLTFSAQYARGDGFIPVIEEQRGSVDRPAEYQQYGFGARFVAPLSDDTEIQANIRAYSDERERGFAFSDNRNDGADASVRLVSRGRWQWEALAYLQLREFQTSFGAVTADRNSVRQVLDQFNVPSTGLGAKFEIRPPVGDNAELRIGGDWRRTIGETNERFFFQNAAPLRGRNAGGRTDTLGGYVEASWQVTPTFLLTGGGRLDYWSIANGFRREFELAPDIAGQIRSDDSFADRDGFEGTGRIGFAYDAASLLTLRGAAYLGWRLPTLNELYRPFRVGADATAANELLEPERLRGVELGLDWEIYTLRFSGTVFYNQLDNAIANVTLDSGPGLFPGVGFVSGAGVFRQRQNLDAVDALGVEIDAAIDIGAFSLSAGYAYVDSEVAGNAGAQTAIDGLRPAQVPQHFANASLDWQPRRNDVSAGVTLRYIGSQFEDDGNTRLLDDAFTLDARANYRLSEKLMLEGWVENLFDAEVQAGISGAGVVERARPQTFWLGLNVRL